MEHETENDDFIEPPGQAILPINAKDAYGLSAEIMGSYLKHGMTEDLRYQFGINEDEARLTLRCADLASLPVSVHRRNDDAGRLEPSSQGATGRIDPRWLAAN